VKRLDRVWLAVFGVLTLALVVTWPTEYVHARPRGVPKLTYPDRNTCYGDAPPPDWVLAHPSVLGLAMLAGIVAVTLAWLFLRSRAPVQIV
jgi:hypothetical protein